MALVPPAAHGKLEVGARVAISWIGAGAKTTDIGTLLYAYVRRKPIADEKGNITHFVLVPFRCGIVPDHDPNVTRHCTNGFEIHQ